MVVNEVDDVLVGDELVNVEVNDALLVQDYDLVGHVLEGDA